MIDPPLSHTARLPYREGALSLKAVPKRMVVIGGGVIGLELGSVWCRLGAEITVIEFAKDICPPMDAQIRKTFQRSLKKQGMNFMMEKKVTSAKKTPTGVKLTVEPSAGRGALAAPSPIRFVFFGFFKKGNLLNPLRTAIVLLLSYLTSYHHIEKQRRRSFAPSKLNYSLHFIQYF